MPLRGMIAARVNTGIYERYIPIYQYIPQYIPRYIPQYIPSPPQYIPQYIPSPPQYIPQYIPSLPYIPALTNSNFEFLDQFEFHFSFFFFFLSQLGMNLRLLILLLVCSLCLGTHSNPKRFDWKCSDVVDGRTIGEIGVLITNRPRGAPAYYVWHPEQMYNWRPVCPDCRGPAKKHGWSKHVVCMASENCALLHPRYSCPTCSTSASTKTFTVCNIRDQWPQEVVDGFPFILTPNSGVDVTLFSMVLEGLVRGVPTRTTANMISAMYNTNFKFVLNTLQEPMTYADWGAPPGTNLLIDMLYRYFESNNGFWDNCLAQIGAAKLSADHTYKVAKKIKVKIDGQYRGQYETCYFVMNELGMVMAWCA